MHINYEIKGDFAIATITKQDVPTPDVIKEMDNFCKESLLKIGYTIGAGNTDIFKSGKTYIVKRTYEIIDNIHG